MESSLSNKPNHNAVSLKLDKTVAEYFAGIGLVRLGLERAGWRVVFANDYSQEKLEMYQARFEDASQHYSTKSVFDLDPADIPQTLLATSSFPCIDLSLAGNMNGVQNGRHSSAFWGFVAALRGQGENAPPIIMVENVPGWLYSNKGADFRVTVQALNQLGYVCDVVVLDALRFTPQSRQRVFLIGSKLPPNHAAVDQLVSRSNGLSSKGLRDALNANADLRWMSLDWPEPPPLRQSGLADEIIEEMGPSDDRWWPAEKTQRHLAMMNDKNCERIEALRNLNRWSYRTFFRRRRQGQQRAEIRDGDIAGCLRTAVGGSSRQFVIALGYGQIKMRNMTPREYARLQGVPDDYPILVEENQALTGFGDAVCVPAIAWIATNALNSLAQYLEESSLLFPIPRT